MALPHTIVEVLNKANLTNNDRLMYECRITSILQKIYDKAYKEGFKEGHDVGMEDCFDGLQTVEKEEHIVAVETE